MEKSKYLFLIEDDQEDVMLFKDAAYHADSGVKIEHAPDCLKALSMLETTISLPDLIVLDYNLPFINGKECLQRLRKVSALKDIPVIFLSTTDCPVTKSEMIKLGAIDFFTKPSRFSDLVQFVRRLLNEQQFAV